MANSMHESDSWVIGHIAPDFTLLDVWALPVYGERADFDAFLEMVDSYDPAHSRSFAVRMLFSARFLIGSLLGWDDPDENRPIPGSRDTSLAARVPHHLQSSVDASMIAESMQRAAGGFKPLYRTDDEWAAEISNETVHGVLHLAWVPDDGGYRAQMAIYVRPRGRLGNVYMKLIQPFRHLIVYPALMRELESAWQDARRERLETTPRR